MPDSAFENDSYLCEVLIAQQDADGGEHTPQRVATLHADRTVLSQCRKARPGIAEHPNSYIARATRGLGRLRLALEWAAERATIELTLSGRLPVIGGNGFEEPCLPFRGTG